MSTAQVSLQTDKTSDALLKIYRKNESSTNEAYVGINFQRSSTRNHVKTTRESILKITFYPQRLNSVFNGIMTATAITYPDDVAAYDHLSLLKESTKTIKYIILKTKKLKSIRSIRCIPIW